MVQIQPSKQKHQDDKSELLNSTVSSEVASKTGARCSVCCMFVSACLFIIYLTIVILMSWILRGYIYVHLKHFLRIDNIYDLNLQSSRNTINVINPSGITYDLSKSSLYPFEINLKPLNNIDDEKSTTELEHEQTDHTFLDLNVLNRLDNDEEFMDFSQIIETDTLSDIISNMSDFILNELEVVEESLKSDVEKLGDGTLKINDIDLFADDIISNISHILEEEIKIIEDSIKSNIPIKNEFPSDKNADRSQGFLGFLGDIFGHHNVRHEFIENSDIFEDRANEKDSFSPRLEHRFDLQEPLPEPYNDHNYLESSEDIILNKAVTSIRNLFGKKENTSPDVVKVHLKPNEQHIRFKVMLLEYLEIFGLVLAAMTFVTFILFLIITRIIGFIDQREMMKRHKLQESIIINDKDQHVI